MNLSGIDWKGSIKDAMSKWEQMKKLIKARVANPTFMLPFTADDLKSKNKILSKMLLPVKESLGMGKEHMGMDKWPQIFEKLLTEDPTFEAANNVLLYIGRMSNLDPL